MRQLTWILIVFVLTIGTALAQGPDLPGTQPGPTVPTIGDGAGGHGTIPDLRPPVFHKTNAPSNALAVEVVEWNRDGTARKQFASSPPKANWYIQCQTSIPTLFGTTYTVATPKNGHSSASNQARAHSITIAKITKGMGAGASQAGAPNFAPADFSSEWPGTGKYEGMTHRVGVWLTPGQDPDDANAAFLTLLEAMTLKFPPPAPPTPGG